MGAGEVNREAAAAVVGAGPCGVAAAVQLRRSGVPVLLFEREDVGGLLWNAGRVENYPGFPRGISGPALCRLLGRHLARVGVSPRFEEVRSAARVEGEPSFFRLHTASGAVYHASVLVVATGTRPVRGVVPGEEALRGRRVFHEVKDLYDRARGARVAVLGGGDAAYDYALNLAARGARVELLRRGPARCLPLLAERAAAEEAVTVEAPVTVRAVEGGGRGVCLRVDGPGGARTLEADFLLVACGRAPEDGLLSGLRGAAPAAGGGGTPSLPPGLYAGGDVVRGPFRQAGIAVGDGLLAAMSAIGYLRSVRVPGEGARPGEEKTER